MNWSRPFDDPITMPDGKTIRTIGEAANYATSLPRKIGDTSPWQLAAKVLHQAAEHGGPFVFIARITFCKALYGVHEAPIGNPKGRKEVKWRNARKLARDR